MKCNSIIRKQGKPKLHDLRIAFAHSKASLRELRDPAEQLTPKVADALFRAICYAAGFEDWETIPQGVILRDFPMRIELDGLLVGGEAGYLGIDGEDPSLEIHHKITKSQTLEDGRYNFDAQSSFTVRINPNATYRPSGIRIYSDPEIEGAITGKFLQRATGGPPEPL